MSVVEDSVLYDMEHFDMVWDVAIDVFHLCYEGITILQHRKMFVVLEEHCGVKKSFGGT